MSSVRRTALRVLMISQMSYLRRFIVGFLSSFIRGKPVKQDSLLLNLPIDIIYVIIDALPLSARILLSQTCRDLWYRMRGTCFSTFQSATFLERWECLATLDDFLSDHRLCYGCLALHTVDPEDLPTVNCQNSDQPCSAPEPRGGRFQIDRYNYAPAFRHIQLAVKYTRLRGIQNSYRLRLLQKFETDLGFYQGQSAYITAEPLVVRGRFLLKTSHVFTGRSQPVSMQTVSQRTLIFCPHNFLGLDDDPTDPFIAAISMNFRNVARGWNMSARSFSCEHCPTDFVIQVDKQVARIFAWADLGMGRSPIDEYWQSHICHSGNSRWSKGPKFDYEHRSVRDMYFQRA